MQFLWKHIDDFVGKGFEWYVIAELMFYASATFVPLALPLAVLLSSLMTFGNLGEYYELVAVKSSGISLQRLMRPLIIFIVFTSFGAFYFSNIVLPKANMEFLSLLRDVRQKKPAVSISEGVFNSDIGEYIIKVGKKHSDGVRIENIIIYDHSSGYGNNNLTLAEKGRMEMTTDKKYLVLELNNGKSYSDGNAAQQKGKKSMLPMQITEFTRQVQQFDLSDFAFKKSDKNLFRNNYQMLNVSQLQYFEDSLTFDRDSVLQTNIQVSFSEMNHYNRFIYSDTIKEIVKTQSNSSKSIKDSLDQLIQEQSGVKKPVNSVVQHEIANRETRVSKVDDGPKQTPKNAGSHSMKIDSIKAFDASFLTHFDSITQVRIVSGALGLARNASYQSLNASQRDIIKAKQIDRYLIEWHRKFTLSIACLLLFFIGAPLGAIIRKGGLGMPMVISILMFVLYHILTIIGEKSVKSMVLDPWVGMWLASVVYLPLGIFISYKAAHDAPLLDAEIWFKQWLKISQWMRKYYPKAKA